MLKTVRPDRGGATVGGVERQHEIDRRDDESASGPNPETPGSGGKQPSDRYLVVEGGDPEAGRPPDQTSSAFSASTVSPSSVTSANPPSTRMRAETLPGPE